MSEFRKRPGVDMQNFEHESTDEDDTHLHHRARNPLINRPPPPPKTTIAAVLLLVLGSIFLVLGLAIYLSGRIYSSDKGISFLALGSLSKLILLMIEIRLTHVSWCSVHTR